MGAMPSSVCFGLARVGAGAVGACAAVLVVLAALGPVLGCTKGSVTATGAGPLGPSSAPNEDTLPLPARAAAVASADALAVQGSHAGALDAARALERAALIRTRLF